MTGLIQELEAWVKKHGIDKEPEIEDLNKCYADFTKIIARAKEKAKSSVGNQDGGLRKRCPNWDIKWDDGGCLKEDGFREPHPEFCPDGVTNNCWIRRKNKSRHPIPQEARGKKIVRHIVEEGSRNHVVIYDSKGAHCTEPNCEMNHYSIPIPQKAQEGLREALESLRVDMAQHLEDWVCVEKEHVPDNLRQLKVVYERVNEMLIQNPVAEAENDGMNFDGTQISTWDGGIEDLAHPQVSPVVPNADRIKALVNDPLRNEIWEYKEELKANGLIGSLYIVDDLEKILEKTGKGGPVKEEALAVLVDRKGKEVVEMEAVIDRKRTTHYKVGDKWDGTKRVIESTIFETEKEARAYLQGLPDKQEEL